MIEALWIGLAVGIIALLYKKGCGCAGGSSASQACELKPKETEEVSVPKGEEKNICESLSCEIK